MFFFFFFQAEDGIRDVAVTGVQTCALPIYFLGPRLDESRQARIQVTKPAPYGATQLLRIAVRTDNQVGLTRGDRKSTRLNSSHGYISYAVFCLKKKKHAATRTVCHARYYTF